MGWKARWMVYLWIMNGMDWFFDYCYNPPCCWLYAIMRGPALTIRLWKEVFPRTFVSFFSLVPFSTRQNQLPGDRYSLAKPSSP
jgi:hypothetical protein